MDELETNKLSKEEFRNMILLLKLFTETELDQWNLWTFDNSWGAIYVTIANSSPDIPDDRYTNLNQIVAEQ